MNDEEKMAYGKVLGEIYRTQRKLGMEVKGSRLYGLLNGILPEIDDELACETISEQQVDHARNILTAISDNPEKMATFSGFYDIEKQLEEGGVDRFQAFKIFKLFRLEGTYGEFFQRMDSINSPHHFRQIDVREYED